MLSHAESFLQKNLPTFPEADLSLANPKIRSAELFYIYIYMYSCCVFFLFCFFRRTSFSWSAWCARIAASRCRSCSRRKRRFGCSARLASAKRLTERLAFAGFGGCGFGVFFFLSGVGLKETRGGYRKPKSKPARFNCRFSLSLFLSLVVLFFFLGGGPVV